MNYTELLKESGMYSEEILGRVGNSVLPIGGPSGALAAAVTPTLTDKQMAEQHKRTITNIVPGLGTYRSWKRSGYYDKKLQRELEKRKIKEEIARKAKESSKKAALTSELVGSAVDPLNLVVGPVAGLAAAITPTKTHEQMLNQQDNRWSNLLPGVGPYRLFKRKGYENAASNEYAKQQLIKEIAAEAHNNKK